MSNEVEKFDKMGKRPGDATVFQRSYEAKLMLCRMMSRTEIYKIIQARHAVCKQTAIKYVERAGVMLAEDAYDNRDVAIAELLGASRNLYQKAYSMGHNAVCLNILKERAALLGLYPESGSAGTNLDDDMSMQELEDIIRSAEMTKLKECDKVGDTVDADFTVEDEPKSELGAEKKNGNGKDDGIEKGNGHEPAKGRGSDTSTEEENGNGKV